MRPHAAGVEFDPGHLVGHPFFLQGSHHPVGAAQHVLRRNGFGGLGAQLGSLGTQRGGLALGVGTFPPAALLVGGASIEILLPTHVVDVDLTAHGVEEPHPVDDIGQQIDVVADDHQPAGVAAQEIPQPAQRIGVEMVGGLVEQQRGRRAGAGVGRREQDARQLHPASLAARQRAQRLGQDPFGQTETRADPACFAFGAVAAECGESLLELAVAAHRTVTRVVVGDLGHQRLLLFQIGEQRVQPRADSTRSRASTSRSPSLGSCGR